jgi:hypothetical protein
LAFGLDIHEGSGNDLQQGCLEARRVRNETNRLDKQGNDWDTIKPTVVDNANHVKNTSQLIVDKTIDEIKTYQENDDWGRPYPYIDEAYPMVMNHGEGYRLFPEDDGTVRYRITATRGTHIKGELHGVQTISNALKPLSATMSGILGRLKSSTNTASGNFTSQSRTRITALPANTTRIRLSASM